MTPHPVRPLLLALGLSLGWAWPAAAQTPDLPFTAAEIEAAQYDGSDLPRGRSALTAKVQLLLDRSEPPGRHRRVQAGRDEPKRDRGVRTPHGPAPGRRDGPPCLEPAAVLRDAPRHPDLCRHRRGRRRAGRVDPHGLRGKGADARHGPYQRRRTPGRAVPHGREVHRVPEPRRGPGTRRDHPGDGAESPPARPGHADHHRQGQPPRRRIQRLAARWSWITRRPSAAAPPPRRRGRTTCGPWRSTRTIPTIPTSISARKATTVRWSSRRGRTGRWAPSGSG